LEGRLRTSGRRRRRGRGGPGPRTVHPSRPRDHAQRPAHRCRPDDATDRCSDDRLHVQVGLALALPV